MSTPQLGKPSSTRQTDMLRPEDYFKAGANMLYPPIYRAAYSDRMAWILASMSQLAYERFEDGEEPCRIFETKLQSANSGFTLIRIFNAPETDTQGFLARNKDFAVLAFRGTEVTKTKDILTDIRASRTGDVHGGFRTAYLSVAADIRKSLSGLGGVPLYVTGHSLGAALAVVATYNLENDGDYPQFRRMIAACYTFGSPRVGNRKYDFRAPIYRVVNTTDIVTAIPLIAMGYVHIGDVRFLGVKEGEFQRGIPILRRLWLFIITVLKFFGPLVKDHGIDHYRRKLQVIAEQRNDPEEIKRHHLEIVK